MVICLTLTKYTTVDLNAHDESNTIDDLDSYSRRGHTTCDFCEFIYFYECIA